MATTPFLSTVGGTATSFIPLPTAWSSAGADCADAIYEQIAGTFLAWDPWYADYINGDLTTCWPPEATSWWNQDASPTTYLGTDFACPSAYYEAYTSSVDSHTAQTICCPSGYGLYVADFERGTMPSQCTSTLTAGETLSWEQIVYITSLGDTWTAATTTVQSETLTIYGIPINGLNVVATSTITSSVSSDAGTGTISSASATATTPGSGSSSSSSGSGSIVGVAVGAALGAVVGVLLVAFGAFLVWRRRRRGGGRTMPGGPSKFASNDVYNSGASMPELAQAGLMQGYYAPNSQHPAELKGSHPIPHELATNGSYDLHELPAGRG